MEVNKILVPTGFDKPSLNALMVAEKLAANRTAVIDFLHIVEIPMAARLNEVGEYESQRETGKNFVTQIQQAAHNQLNKLLAQFKDTTVEINPLIKIVDDPKNIEKLIAAEQYDLMVVGGNTRHHLHKLLLDTSHEKLIEHAKCPVLTVNDTVSNFAPGHIIIPTNFNPDIRKVADKIRQWQQLYQSKVTMVYINTPGNFKNTMEIEEGFKELAHHHGLTVYDQKVFNHKHVEQGILLSAEYYKADLIIMLSGQESKLKRMIHGDYVDGVVNHSRIPVLTFNLKN